MSAPDLSWQDEAACAGRTSEMYPVDDAGEAAAKAICARCPVVEPCAEAARVNREPAGVWGGQTPTERSGRPAEHYRKNGAREATLAKAEKAAAMRERGMSRAEVAEAMGVRPQTVAAWLSLDAPGAKTG